jgi:hypothetical protein
MNNALLAQLSIRMLGVRHKDKSLTADVHERHAMSADAGLYQKCILPEACLSPLRKLMSAARADHRSKTLMTPYGPLLPTARMAEYTRAMDSWQQQWHRAVAKFVQDYPANIELARVKLNGSFNREDYPAAHELPGIFAFDSRLLPLPSASALDEITGLADDRVAELRSQLQRTQREAATAARTEFMNRILDRLQRFARTMANPEAPVREGSLQHLQELIDMAPAYNLTGDPGISRLVADARASLTLAAEAVRDNPQVRTRNAAAAQILLQSHGRKIQL